MRYEPAMTSTDQMSRQADEAAGVPAPDLLVDRSARGLAGLLIVAGIMHFLVPSPYERIVPAWAGDPKRAVRWSGWAELACGSLVAVPGSRRLGAWASLVLLVAVYPANIKMALDAGRPHDAMSWGAWLRLPLQVPLWCLAVRVAKRASRPA